MSLPEPLAPAPRGLSLLLMTMPLVVELHGKTDRIEYAVIFVVTVVVLVGWGVWQSKKRKRLPAPTASELAASKAQDGQAWRSVRSLEIAGYSVMTVGVVLVLVSIGNLKSPIETTGIGLVVLGWLVKSCADVTYWLRRRATRRRAKSC